MFIGNIGILNICLNPGINNIISISAADNAIAPSNTLLLNGCVLNIDFLLFLILNTCTSSEKASVTNAIVWPISTFTSCFSTISAPFDKASSSGQNVSIGNSGLYIDASKINKSKSYASGIENGPVTYTGMAMLHGSPSNPEFVLNSD